MQNQAYKIRGTKVTSPYPVELTPAETRLIFSLQKYFSPEHIYPDCYFPIPESKTTNLTSHDRLVQIDCLAINQRGIFVFESKDYSGWIYGGTEEKYWTATLDFGHTKNQFYNPILQNSNHINCLRTIFPTQRIYSCIVFGPNATFKTCITPPANCFICTQSQLNYQISQLPQNLLTTQELINIDCIIKASRIIPNQITRSHHISEVQNAQNRPMRRS